MVYPGFKWFRKLRSFSDNAHCLVLTKLPKIYLGKFRRASIGAKLSGIESPLNDNKLIETLSNACLWHKQTKTAIEPS